MDSIVGQIRSLAESADAVGRNQILNTLRDLQYDLETPMDTYMKFVNSNIQLAMVYVGVELGLFKELVKAEEKTLTLDDLVKQSSASPDLLERILRYLSSTGLMLNVGPNQFQANRITHLLADPLADAGICYAFDAYGPAVQACPSFLAETHYRDFAVDNKASFQKGHNTELGSFQWMINHPKLFNGLQKMMTALQSSNWVVGFDLLDQEARTVQRDDSPTLEKPFLVDVGGGHGHQCKQLLEKYPNLHGSIVLQDLPQAVEGLPPMDGVRAMAQDFFEKQTIKGAKFYYLRRIFHDWGDADCLKILKNLAVAMNSNSRILIDEVILPDVNAHWQAAVGDISMGIMIGGKERTKRQWEALIAQSGLRLSHIHSYNAIQCNSVIVLELQ
ncbi:uncharacterized protein Z518_06758 [Rhinocladiella mackenziei CBS 650.93]|uniref:O-methyltransferase domain-containing protein n=1 Tax=Rhinocladiella mackenziei CBS 650.93 TaxID=1442369 RepID=A0A0D2IIT5_9EURO|nr:uncharacterized protein Z518_06758 [Rhinocladiella mackenziei CBS 650.93]KIX03206.1 hypothetical protein Z518_06758 [Rhinocladiella mackenziei CBS 650.93]